jgi:hypothetical protein
MNLQNNKEANKYHCTQQELYAIATIGWESCKQYEADFAALKPKYTVAYIDGKLATIEAVRALPDEETRTAFVKTKRQALQAKAAVCLTKWQALKLYINSAFSDPVAFETNVEEAGQGKYKDAANEDWEEVYGLMEAGKNYITAHTAELEANDNMPLTFAAAFDTATDEFDVAYKAFKKMEEDVEVMASDKLEANNELFDELTEMFADGQHIYRYDAAKRERFVFDRVKDLVSTHPGNGGGGVGNELTFSGTVTDNVTGAFLADATLESDGEVIATTNVLGQFSITFPITEVLNVQLTIKKTGYNDYVTPIQFSPGTDLEQNFTMQRIILTTFQQNMGQGNYNLGNAPAGTTGLRITLISGSAATVGFSNDGMTFAGNTETVSTINEPVDRTLAELGGYALYVLAQNNDLNPVTVKVEVLG